MVTYHWQQIMPDLEQAYPSISAKLKLNRQKTLDKKEKGSVNRLTSYQTH